MLLRLFSGNLPAMFFLTLKFPLFLVVWRQTVLSFLVLAIVKSKICMYI